MKTFQVNKKIMIECKAENTRSGFRHLATLYIDYVKKETVKCTYLNRTWERYEFESVLKKLADETTTLSDSGKKLLQKYIKNGDRVKDDLKPLKTVGVAMAMGEMLGKTQKQKNDWKTRMLKAGLGNKGLIMPEDWNKLNEKEKEKRLNKIIKMLGKT